MIRQLKFILWGLKERILIRIYKSKKIDKEVIKINNLYEKFKEKVTNEPELLDLFDNAIMELVYQPAFVFYWNYEKLKTSGKTLLIENIKKIDPFALNIFQWLALYRFFSSSGHFLIANQYREKAISLTLSISINIFSPMRLFLKFTLSLELGDLKSAEKALKMMKTSPFRLLLQVNSFERLLSIYLKKELKYKYSMNDVNYAKFIKDKSIAVVGPAPSKVNYNCEIDSSDFVVRLNYKGQIYRPEDNKGTKINCSYYNGEYSREIFLDNHFQIDKPIYYNFKSNFKRIIKKITDLGNARKIEYFRVEFDGSFNMIQLTILDLLKFKPKLINLYGTNFFLSKKSHSESYINDFSNKDFYSKCKTFTLHNPIIQFRTIKNLSKLGLIEANDELNKILSMDETIYLKKFDDLYGIRAYKFNAKSLNQPV